MLPVFGHVFADVRCGQLLLTVSRVLADGRLQLVGATDVVPLSSGNTAALEDNLRRLSLAHPETREPELTLEALVSCSRSAVIAQEAPKASEPQHPQQPQQLQPFDLVVVPLELWAPEATSSPLKQPSPDQLQQLQTPAEPVDKEKESEAKEGEACARPQQQLKQLQQLQPSKPQPGLDASFDAWCVAMAAPTPTPAKRPDSRKRRAEGDKKSAVVKQAVVARSSSSTRRLVGPAVQPTQRPVGTVEKTAAESKEEQQQLLQSQHSPVVVPDWFSPLATSTPKRKKLQPARPTTRRSIIIAPSDEHSSIYDTDAFDFVDGAPQPSTEEEEEEQQRSPVDAGWFLPPRPVDRRQPQQQQLQPRSKAGPTTSASRRTAVDTTATQQISPSSQQQSQQLQQPSARRRPRSDSDDSFADDYWNVYEAFWRKVHSKRAKHVESKREQPKVHFAPTLVQQQQQLAGPAPRAVQQKQQPDLAVQALKTANSLGLYVYGGKSLSKRLWSTGRTSGELDKAWRGITIQVGSRRSDVEKGAKRALPKLKAAIDGSRDHARQFTAYNDASAIVTAGHEALLELAKAFAFQVARDVRTGGCAYFTEELKALNTTFKEAAAKQLTEVRTWRKLCDALPC